ncbi:Concanavalin A-like lectin/glucanases superfamily [Penicillium chrysogenum]|uniref:chitinase n=1 Tax=Penicillium chrysogenum TaxID=5076 RepID=A0ABQ8WAE2_PENCH|nr:Concanavalin A-like lectin/glucanases superfamily [Penicillium chrysogenum]KAJ5238149.1 Concanavalin A-like lectin/glucanases superfamily [Penicillium chrysogenum]KAJ5261583.1 Concanavalin A-like lectin/glucanases superfamily [Penicillium chrysogenum]KAJ5278450.1 Concanavalin A-like lectin/glucanases superfamily [Penicillium chrysogenum]KAJ6159509.1 Concanavalin A-like lectin/glucanases superfamily [Penicillium chrysogenum]
MRSWFSFFLLALITILGVTNVNAEYTGTDCNPLNKTCSADPALGTEHTWLFNSTLDSELWDMRTGTLDYTSEGADFSIKTENASTLLVSNFYIFFGVMEAHVKMAKGAGIISSVVLQSDDLDEIDWEWVGYNTSGVQSNFFGKGNTTTSDRGGYHAVSNADTEFHNYTSYWDRDRLEWWIDGDLVRTVNYSEPLTVYGKNYPQTPCQVKVSNWPVGIKGQSQGNLDWGGGLVDWSDVPFTMTVSKIRVQDFSSGKEYKYTGRTGTYDSIEVVSGNSTAITQINKKPAKTLSQKWDDLGQGAHIGVYCGAAVAGALLIGIFVFYCLKQRRDGRLQRALNDGEYSAELTTLEESKLRWRQSELRSKGSYQPVP